MSWIQENKFISGLIGVTAVIGGGIIYFGLSEGGTYDEKMVEFQGLKTNYTKLVTATPYPDAQNLEARQDNIEQYEGVITDVRKSLAGYHRGELPKLTPEQFSDVQLKMQNELRRAFNQAGTTLPDKCGFGFEKYADIQAKAMATARLNYQLGAMQWLLGKLAETKPQALINIRRKELGVERGVPATSPPEPPKGRRGSSRRGGGRSQAKEVDQKLFVMMPVELSFTATEASMRDFLKEMANSKEYFYAIRAIRIRNEKQIAPTIKDADFKGAEDIGAAGGGEGAIPAGEDIFGDFTLPDTEGDGEDAEDVIAVPEVEVRPVASGHILKQVLGNEKLNIHISFDILLINSGATPDGVTGEPTPGGS